jgi:hypothetical protein
MRPNRDRRLVRCDHTDDRPVDVNMHRLLGRAARQRPSAHVSLCRMGPRVDPRGPPVESVSQPRRRSVQNQNVVVYSQRTLYLDIQSFRSHL